MTIQHAFDPRKSDPNLDGIIKLAVMAVGGQGGGVLASWIEEVARASGYEVQATSVAGVAQRTGATIYYLEMCPQSDRQPVFSLMPAAGDVDIVIAAELMEAGRAIMRGFVTPDRTVLIASSHRVLAVSEKSVPGDGIADTAEAMAAAEIAARRLVVADFEGIAVASGSVISASLFGALAGSGALPFQREAFETVVRASRKGVDGSIRAFEAAVAAAVAKDQHKEDAAPLEALGSDLQGPENHKVAWRDLNRRLKGLPPGVARMAEHGLRKVVDFQDLAYGSEYIGQIETIFRQDNAERDYELSCEAAKYVANAMTYDDVIRVADLKTRGDRFRRIRKEMSASDANIVHLTEFFHPTVIEIVGMLPVAWGEWVEARPGWMARIDRWFGKGRRLRTDSLPAFLTLFFLGGLQGYRRRTLRHHRERALLERWLTAAVHHLPHNYDLAVEMVRCRRLIKGYSDTHARGLGKFDRVMEGVALIAGRDDAADWARRLREAALMDEEGKALDGALETIRSFA